MTLFSRWYRSAISAIVHASYVWALECSKIHVSPIPCVFVTRRCPIPTPRGQITPPFVLEYTSTLGSMYQTWIIFDKRKLLSSWGRAVKTSVVWLCRRDSCFHFFHSNTQPSFYTQFQPCISRFGQVIVFHPRHQVSTFSCFGRLIFLHRIYFSISIKI